jgi:hypothetical protein
MERYNFSYWLDQILIMIELGSSGDGSLKDRAVLLVRPWVNFLQVKAYYSFDDYSSIWSYRLMYVFLS